MRVKFVRTLVAEFKQIESNDAIKYDTFYSNSKAETITNERDIDDVFKSINGIIMSNIQNSLGKGPCWIIDSITDHNINISKYNALAGSGYTKLPKELDDPQKRLINIQYFDVNALNGVS